METKIKKSTIYSSSPKIKYLSVNLLKYGQGLYDENYETLKKTQDKYKWRQILCSWIGRQYSNDVSPPTYTGRPGFIVLHFIAVCK